MIAVIIAGGSGTRLWPLSTSEYPKHLLKLTEGKSLLQNTFDRAKTLTNSIYVVTDASHAHHVQEQLPKVKDSHFIIEPGRRGTASCIVAALCRISDNHPEDEPIAFMAADHYIRDLAGFTHSFKIASTVSERQKRIVLVGIEPDYPATGFGYIQKDGMLDEEKFVFKVNSFKEKPAYQVAKKYLTSGQYLWNAGYFVGSLKTFLSAMRSHAPKLYANYQKISKSSTPEEYKQAYLSFANEAIDYALIEKTKSLLAVPASFDWMDLGSYSDVHKAVDSDELGNHANGYKIELDLVENSFIRNDENKPVAVIGLDNVVVVNTPHGLLVARKDLAQKVGDITKRL